MVGWAAIATALPGYSKKSWFASVKNMTKLMDILPQNFQNNRTFYVNKIQTYMKEHFIKNWVSELQSDERKGSGGNKLRTYRKFKQDYKLESYLINCTNPLHRKSITRFRLSAHRLNIEQLRYVTPRILPENRTCNNCTSGECEDEFHFSMTCSKYADLRDEFFTKVSSQFGFFKELNMERKFIWLCHCKNPNVICLFGKYLYDLFQLRAA